MESKQKNEQKYGKKNKDKMRSRSTSQIVERISSQAIWAQDSLRDSDSTREREKELEMSW